MHAYSQAGKWYFTIMKTTLSKIAQRAGVSTITASRVLRGMGRVKPQTRQKVVESAKQLGYHKLNQNQVVPVGKAASDMHLRVLINGRGQMIDSLEDHGISSRIRSHFRHGLQSQLLETGGKLISVDLDSLERIQGAIKQYKPHGLVLRQPIPTDWLEQLKSLLPVIYAVSYDHQCGVDSIYTNEHRSAAMVYKKLYDLGHREIAWLGIVDRNCVSQHWQEMLESSHPVDRLCSSAHAVRYAAWANLAYCQLNSNKQQLVIMERNWKIQSLEEVVQNAVDQFVQSRPQPTAIITPADQIAMKVVALLRRRGLSVPDDISVVGYGGTLVVEGQIPEMASVVLPMEAIGRTVSELIRRRLADPQALPVSMQLETQLIDGQSIGPCRIH